jgi:SAM-dependent methyltransferase
LKPLIFGKHGIEIGGPSKNFSKRGLIPIYPHVLSLDNVNFSEFTIWEGKLINGSPFSVKNEKVLGHQFIREATDMFAMPSEHYDFLCSNHVIQHSANPLRALEEWKRVIKINGLIIIVVPHKSMTFDHKRPVTSMEHLISDYNNNIGEDDLTHLEEILKLHDLSRDAPAGNFEQFKKRSIRNYENRALHHHVFDEFNVIEIIDFIKLQIIDVELHYPCNIIVICKKVENESNIDNSTFKERNREYKFHGKFLYRPKT